MGRAVPGSKTREERLTGKGPKRILAIDAAGPRAILAAALLGGLESRLRKEKNDPDLRLWDHFDLIGGASSGAFLAGALCAGASVEEACGLIEDAGPALDASLRGDAVRRPKFDPARLADTLEEAFGDAVIGDPRIRTGFAALVKPLESGPVEIWSNAPNAPSAERTFQEAIVASLGGDCSFDGRGGFADSALAAPCPVWPLLRFAISPRGLNWPTGANKLQVVSVGAGRLRPGLPIRVFDGPIDPNPAALAANVATRAGYALEAALFDATEEALAALAEVAAPEGGSRAGALLSFSRLDLELSTEALSGLGLSPGEIQAATERRPATAATVALWRRIGELGVRYASERALQQAAAPAAVSSLPGEESDASLDSALITVAPDRASAPQAQAAPEPKSAPLQPRPPRSRSRLESLAGVLGGKPARPSGGKS